MLLILPARPGRCYVDVQSFARPSRGHGRHFHLLQDRTPEGGGAPGRSAEDVRLLHLVRLSFDQGKRLWTADCSQDPEAKALVALWCPLSVDSHWVVEECDLAHALGILIPTVIEPCELPIGFRRHSHIDLSSWDGSPRSHQLDPLIQELAKRIGRLPSLNAEALWTYEATWRRFGAPSLRTFALGQPLADVEDDRKLPVTPQAPAANPLATKPLPVSNIPIRVPKHFMGRDDALAAIDAAFASDDSRLAVAITALHGLRGVGKSTLAAAYAERHRREVRLAWWIGAHEDTSLRAGLVGLGIRLGWVDKDDKEEPALTAVMERLRNEGDGLLLIYDNAAGADAVAPWLPHGGGARVIVTSNDHAWRGVATLSLDRRLARGYRRRFPDRPRRP
jgi:hypothetical protein